MKVAIISYYFMETSIPLARHLSEKGIAVDLYSILPLNAQNASLYDFTTNKQPAGFVPEEIQRKAMGEELVGYLGNISLRTFIWPDRRPYQIIGLDYLYAFLFARRIRKEKYDIIHVIQPVIRFGQFLNSLLERNKMVVTFHEVTSHQGKTAPHIEQSMSFVIQHGIPAIVHSDISKKRLLAFANERLGISSYDDKVRMIRFGLFETYLSLNSTMPANTNTSKVNILFFGRIVPYKGIQFLADATKILQEKYPVQLTIAGNGKPYFDLSGINDYQFINRFITNDEIVSMIKDADFIVLPYTSASQSGIPMTVYCFNKPIIATDLDGFREVIDHLETGLLVKDLNAENLAAAMELLITDKELCKMMKKNIEKKYHTGSYSWSQIADQTIELYRETIT